MKYFLSPSKRDELVKSLVNLGMPEISAKEFSLLEDNMREVDIALLSHAQCITHFQEKLDADPTSKSVSALDAALAQGHRLIITIMYEAISRGYAETDFPISHEYIKAAVMADKRTTKNIN